MNAQKGVMEFDMGQCTLKSYYGLYNELYKFAIHSESDSAKRFRMNKNCQLIYVMALLIRLALKLDSME